MRFSGQGKNDLTSSLEYVSKVTYGYDEEDFTFESNQNISSVIQHDSTGYAASFYIGRGNWASTTRWNVEYPAASGYAVTSRVRYDIAGSPVARLDPLGRKVSVGYADGFNDAVNRNSFAYPTTLTDAAGASLGDAAHSSTVKYRFDIGANIRAESPAPAGNSQGKITTREFDAIGRLSKETILNGGAYTRYEYPLSGIQSKVYSTIIDTNNNNTGDAADEVLSESFTDGAGRVRMSRTPHTFDAGGGTLTWAASLTEYDSLGRVKRQSVPTEVDSSWTPTGDDQTRGFLWSYQKYDWKGRVVRKINTDGTDSPTLNDSDILISYEGCGCAGGQVTIIQSESVPRDDQPTVNARRTQKVYEDLLGRTWKRVQMKWDGTTAYTTVENSFNGRDQIIKTKQTDNTSIATPQTHQETSATFDGHGRLKQSHRPEQQTSTGGPAYTTYSYNADDSIAAVTDARSAVTNYTYNDPRGLLTQVSWSVPTGSTIPVPASGTFSYDNLGNRTLMTDGLGTQTYSYDQLSRLASETRGFTGFNSYTLNYAYGLGGQLASIGDPGEPGRTISYVYDKTGGLKDVNGAGFGNVTQYLNGISYRAFGSVKGATYGSGRTLTLAYDNRLSLSRYAVGQTANTSYQYYADGQTKSVSDQMDNRFDRLYRYDHLGRVTRARSGLEARDEMQTSEDSPYRQDYGWDAFGNLASRANRVWSQYLDPISDTYVNNRRQSGGPTSTTYDADGREAPTQEEFQSRLTSAFDAAGQRRTAQRDRWTVFPSGGHWVTQSAVTRDYGGDGQRLRQLEDGQTDWIYYVRSSVLGGEVVAELTKVNGASYKSVFVYALGDIIARQKRSAGVADEVVWNYRNPITGSQRGAEQTEPDPLGVDHGTAEPPSDPEPDPGGSGLLNPARYADAFNGRSGCTIDGSPASCDLAASVVASGAGRVGRGGFRAIYSNRDQAYVGFAAYNANQAANGVSVFGLPTGWAPIGMNFTSSVTPYESGFTFTSSFASSPFLAALNRDLSATGAGPVGYLDQLAESGVATLGQVEELSSAYEGGRQMSCGAALQQAGKTPTGLARAQAALPQVMQNVGDVNIARLLAAIGVQETDFLDVRQQSGGPGRGIFQIEPKTYGITVAEARNLPDAVNAIANNWSRQWNDILTAFSNGGYDITTSETQYTALAGLARIHNRGRGGVVRADKRGSVSAGSLLDLAAHGGGYAALDNKGGTINNQFRETAHGTYVRNVMDLFFSCFGG